MEQIKLFDDEKKKKSINHIPINKLVISEYNPRRTRDKDDIDNLAKRIERNGYEITRALWAYQENGYYKVFAGGNRLEAAKDAGVNNIPTVIHEGFTDKEIIQLAIQDNENDEYHAEVPMVDIWDFYASLYEELETQQAVADLLGVSQKLVNFKINLASLPEWLKNISTKQNWKERQMREFLRLVPGTKTQDWLSWDEALECVVQKILTKKIPKAKLFADAVDGINETIEYVEGEYERLGTVTLYSFDEDPPQPYEWDAADSLLKALIEKEARTLDVAKECVYEINKTISDNHEKYQSYLSKKTKASKPIEVNQGEWWKLGDHYLYCGDTGDEKFYKSKYVENIKFIFADPPYNEGLEDWDTEFEWQHDWLVDKSPLVAVTPGIRELFNFAQITDMPYRWSVSCWIDNGMTRGALGYGNWIYIALFSKDESIYMQEQDMIRVSISGEEKRGEHKGKKPIELLKELIDKFTETNDVVLDPFLGSGTTLLASELMGRRCVGGEKKEEYCKEIIKTFEGRTGEKAEKLDE